MLKGFDVIFTHDDGTKLTFHYLWPDSIWVELNQWRACVDVVGFDVIDCETCEVMYSYSTDSELYICSDWREWGLS